MSRRVSISITAARALLEGLDRPQVEEHLLQRECYYRDTELRRAVKPRRLSRKPGCRRCGRDLDERPCGPDHVARQAAIARAAELKACANATRRAFGLRPLVSKLRKPSKEEKRESRASIREKVFARAGGRCEGPAGSNPLLGGRCLNPATDLQHVFGKGKGRMPESERNCLAACRTCHDAEGRNDPSGAIWWDWFWAFFVRNRWAQEASAAAKRAQFERTRASLPAAPTTRP